MEKNQDAADNEKGTECGSTLSHDARWTHTSCQSGLIDNGKSRMVLYLRDSRDLREKREG